MAALGAVRRKATWKTQSTKGLEISSKEMEIAWFDGVFLQFVFASNCFLRSFVFFCAEHSFRTPSRFPSLTVPRRSAADAAGIFEEVAQRSKDQKVVLLSCLKRKTMLSHSFSSFFFKKGCFESELGPRWIICRISCRNREAAAYSAS